MPNSGFEMCGFSKMEATLADMHGIASIKRAAFMARIKHFIRLKFPPYISTHKGKTTQYSDIDIVKMAIALDITQLGLLPDRIVRLLNFHWYPCYMAISDAADELRRMPAGYPETVGADRPPSAFIFFESGTFDNLLSGEQDFDDSRVIGSMLYGDEKVAAQHIVDWTSGICTSRIGVLNVTSLLDKLAKSYFGKTDAHIEARRAFFSDLSHNIKMAVDIMFEGVEDLRPRFVEAFTPDLIVPSLERAHPIEVMFEYWERAGANVSTEA